MASICQWSDDEVGLVFGAGGGAELVLQLILRTGFDGKAISCRERLFLYLFCNS